MSKRNVLIILSSILFLAVYGLIYLTMPATAADPADATPTPTWTVAPPPWEPTATPSPVPVARAFLPNLGKAGPTPTPTTVPTAIPLTPYPTASPTPTWVPFPGPPDPSGTDSLVGIDLPETVIYGHRPMTMTTTIANTDAVSQSFDVAIWHGGPAWGKEDYPYSFSEGTEVYNLYCDTNGCTHYWRGNLEIGATATFTLPTFSGTNLGTYQLAQVGFISPTSVPTATANITLTEGAEPTHGHLWAEGPRPWLPGQLRGLWLLMEAPTLTQFVSYQAFTSTCGVEGLPGGFTGHPQRTYQQFLWYVYLPSDAPMGRPCTINGTFQRYHLPGIYRVSYTFVAGYSTFLPVVYRGEQP